jgi:hypothetical protein
MPRRHFARGHPQVPMTSRIVCLPSSRCQRAMGKGAYSETNRRDRKKGGHVYIAGLGPSIIDHGMVKAPDDEVDGTASLYLDFLRDQLVIVLGYGVGHGESVERRSSTGRSSP